MTAVERWRPVLARLWSGWTGRLLRLALLAAMVGYLALTVNLAAAFERASTAQPALVLTAVLVLTAAHAIAALTWQAIVRRLGGVLSVVDALRAYYAAQALGGLTPANLGGDAYRVVAGRSSGSGWSSSAAAVLLQRASSFAALALLALVALLATPRALSLVAPLIGVALLVVVLLAAPAAALLRRCLGELSGTSLSGIAASAGIGLAGGLALHGVAIAAGYLLVLSVDPQCGGLAILAAVALARLALAVPISPSGLGIQEGALAALFVALGASPETAVAASLLGRISLLLTTGLGVLLMSWRGVR